MNNNSPLPPPPPPPSTNPPITTKTIIKPQPKPKLPKVKFPAITSSTNENLDGYNGVRSWTEISPKQVVLGSVIANGTFGNIQNGEYEGQKVAVKVMNAKHIGSYDYSVFYNEICILADLTHENIVKMRGANTLKGSTYFIVLEYIAGGDLYNYLEKHGHSITWREILNIAIGTAKGMQYIHSKGILFRDLKSSNILLREDLTPVICDFGTALKEETNPVIKNEATGTPLWMSPEVYMKEKFTTKADVYSFGIILNELVSGLPPFFERQDEDWEILLKEVVRNDLRPRISDFCPDVLRDLITRCTHSTVGTRPSFDEVISILESAETEKFPTRVVATRQSVQAEIQGNKAVTIREEKMNLLQHIFKCQNEKNEWEWAKAPFAALATDSQIVRAKLRSFLRNVGVLVSEDGPRCDVWTTCIIYCYLDLIIKSLDKETPSSADTLTSLKKENWKENTEQTIQIGFTRLFVGLDPHKRAFTTWDTQLLPLANEFVAQYTNVKSLL